HRERPEHEDRVEGERQQRRNQRRVIALYRQQPGQRGGGGVGEEVAAEDGERQSQEGIEPWLAGSPRGRSHTAGLAERVWRQEETRNGWLPEQATSRLVTIRSRLSCPLLRGGRQGRRRNLRW